MSSERQMNILASYANVLWLVTSRTPQEDECVTSRVKEHLIRRLLNTDALSPFDNNTIKTKFGNVLATRISFQKINRFHEHAMADSYRELRII